MKKILSFILVLLVLFVLTGLTGCDENVSGDIASSADETEIYTQADDENSSNESMPTFLIGHLVFSVQPMNVRTLFTGLFKYYI